MVLEIRSITKKYSAKTVLDKVSLKLEPGIYGLLGQNGAGKSTLMNIIVGILSPTSGQVVYDGQEISALGRGYRNSSQYALTCQAQSFWRICLLLRTYLKRKEKSG